MINTQSYLETYKWVLPTIPSIVLFTVGCLSGGGLISTSTSLSLGIVGSISMIFLSEVSESFKTAIISNGVIVLAILIIAFLGVNGLISSAAIGWSTAAASGTMTTFYLCKLYFKTSESHS